LTRLRPSIGILTATGRRVRGRGLIRLGSWLSRQVIVVSVLAPTPLSEKCGALPRLLQRCFGLPVCPRRLNRRWMPSSLHVSRHWGSGLEICEDAFDHDAALGMPGDCATQEARAGVFVLAGQDLAVGQA
jgi:hypothetical protein